MATAAPDAAAAAPAGGGKKKLIMIIVIALVVMIIGAGAAILMMKKKAHAAEGEDGAEADAEPAHAEVAHPKPGTPPVYLPLEPFTVNLTDKETDRYAQIAVTLEVTDQKTADLLKGYMPAIRSGVLVVISHKSAVELLSKEGKERLQREVLAEAVRPLGFEVELEDDTHAAPADEEEKPKAKKKKKKKKAEVLPVTQVLFSQFIVQ